MAHWEYSQEILVKKFPTGASEFSEVMSIPGIRHPNGLHSIGYLASNPHLLLEKVSCGARSWLSFVRTQGGGWGLDRLQGGLKQHQGNQDGSARREGERRTLGDMRRSAPSPRRKRARRRSRMEASRPRTGLYDRAAREIRQAAGERRRSDRTGAVHPRTRPPIGTRSEIMRTLGHDPPPAPGEGAAAERRAGDAGSPLRPSGVD